MINSIRKRYVKLNFTLASAAVLFSFLTILLLLSSANKYEPKLISSGIADQFTFSTYLDLNRNGIDEKFDFGKALEAENYFFHQYDDNGKLKEQFNFSNHFLFSSIFNYDLNDDNFEELVLFTKDDSLLYLSIVDLKNSRFLKKEFSIIKKPASVVTDYWDLNKVVIKILFDESLDRNVMYLSPITGHSIHPRGLYKFDIQTGELLNKLETTAPVAKFVFIDTNNDGINEIVLSAGSSGNTRDKTGIHDNSNWLIKLNQDFEFVNEPLEIGEFLNGIEFDIVKHNNRDLILLIFSNRKNQDPKEFFALMDFDFNILNKKEFERNEGIRNFFKTSNPFDNFFYILTAAAVYKYDIDFNKLNTLNLGKDDYSFELFDDILESDGKELLVRNQKNVFILTDDLEILFSYESENTIRDMELIKNVKNSNSELLILTDKNLKVFSIHKNLLAQYRVPAFLLTSFLFYLILLLLHKAFSKVARISGAYNYSYDDINLGLIITDYKGAIKSFNKSVVYNLPPNLHIHKNENIFDIFKGNYDLIDCIKETFKTEKETSREISFTKGDYKFVGKVNVLPLFTLFNIPHSFIIKIQNLTEEIHKERNSLWASISQKVAHDIKTPLSTIQLNLTALKTRINSLHELNKDLINDDIEMIHSEVKHITNLTKSFLKFSSLNKPSFQWIDTKKLIEDSADNFQIFFDSDLKFNTEISEDAKTIWVDPNQMVQLFHLLIENAIDAVGSHGIISITVDLAEHISDPNEKYVEFLISDNGKGIPEEELSKIFEPYFTKKKEGTGMGLTIARKIVQDHNGIIEVTSKLNFGTTFSVKIPHKIEQKYD
ncbi:MAG: HAMP domain-containing histidine kinase [Melioribacteraceae bacterium]|nr:HAMP domain-containing histidine kinase [Melioribacteraceae bacterium]